MSRKKYHVTKSGDGTWKGTAQGGQRASVVADTKAEAVRKTIELAKKQQDSQVIIHKQDGKIQEERTYGNDPHPPDG
ncbi:DUF2188 domain-containing protein [uncultured Winogradskyella sp.]|uniref:DUF2188 domain-containing protein n=1 Tax=uncultured Winogradskyella sp. TaxID=395353 RepID=UPI002613EEE3|nr:DUF2188 domain-containing protein [uncultured Winogradskyella sp.]